MFLNNDIKKQLEQLSNEEENKKCFDCGGQPARCISLNNGIYLCNSCSEEHKKLEHGLSVIKSITLDQWNKNQLNIMKKGGNKNLKIFLEENNIDINIDKNILYNSKLMVYYRNKLKAEAEDKLLLDMLPPKEEFLESFQENENDENSNNLDLNGILNSNKGKNYYNNNGEYPSFKNNSIDNYNNYFNDNNQIIDDNLIEYPKSEIKIDEDHYSFAKENKKLKEKYQNSILNKDTLLDKTEEDNEKYNSIGSEPYNTSNSSIFQNSGYIGTVGNILHTVWDTGVQATSGVREKMNEYTLGKGVLYIGGKLVEGVVYIGGKIYEKSVDIINSEMTRNIFNKAGEGISYISQKITKNKNNGENNENNNYIDISDNINYDKNKNYIKHSDIENNYNILNDKSENLL
jgi:hypothetical protein